MKTQCPLSPIGGLNSKSHKNFGLPKRKFVIRHIGIQVQPPSSCRPCPFRTYCGEMKHERFHPAGWREFREDRCNMPYEIREEIHAHGRKNHKDSILIHEGARQVFPSKVIVEPCEVAFSRPALVVCLYDALLVAVPVVGDDAAVDLFLSEEVWRLILNLCTLHDDAVVRVLHEVCTHERCHLRLLRPYLHALPFLHALYAAVHGGAV